MRSTADLLGIDVPYLNIETLTLLQAPHRIRRLYSVFGETDTREKKRPGGLESLDSIAALNPEIAVPDDKRTPQADEPRLIEVTKEYILAFEEELSGVENPGVVESRLNRKRLYQIQTSCPLTAIAPLVLAHLGLQCGSLIEYRTLRCNNVVPTLIITGSNKTISSHQNEIQIRHAACYASVRSESAPIMLPKGKDSQVSRLYSYRLLSEYLEY
ncbi:hypothetical protein F5884DRAFT_857085 [Xylogone sp. PMI_703]|nr:hypothetical protein F5884DRAFT_857085 [Xylogone sp. PMI_703]